jgi:CRISPR-associated protein Cas1
VATEHRREARQKGGPRLLVTDREGALYLERAHVHVEDGRVVYAVADDDLTRRYNIPHVNLAVLFLGQGTSITQEAMRLLGEEYVHLAVTGSGGSPMHMGALTTYTATSHFRRMLPIYAEPARSMVAATSLMRGRIERMRSIGAKAAGSLLRARDRSPIEQACARFAADLESCADLSQLLGYEGAFSKACYRAFGQMAGLDGFRRAAGSQGGEAASDERTVAANRLIDHGNYLCYGMAGAALWALGLPPHLSVLHGKTRAGGLVFDIADGFKDALVLPIAFHCATRLRDADPEATFRAKLIEAFDDERILVQAVETIEDMLTAAGGLSSGASPDA